MKLLVINREEVSRALPMEKAIESVAQAYLALSAGQAAAPHRTAIKSENGISLFMPGYLPAAGALVVKAVSIFPGNPARGVPTANGSVLLLDRETGRPAALIEASGLTAIRTGAASGLASQLLARPESRVLALFGAGGQAWRQAEAVITVRPIEEVRVYTPGGASAAKMAERISLAFPRVSARAVASPALALAGADIVACATTSKTPVFAPELIGPGVHINGVGSFTLEMQEVPAAGLYRPRIFVDSVAACLEEAGELVAAMEQGAIAEADWVELGLVLAGKAAGRQSAGEVTFFKSVGVAAQDAAAAAMVYRLARERGMGVEVEL